MLNRKSHSFGCMCVKCQPHKHESSEIEQYLYKHAVIDGHGNLDGAFVPMSIAMIAVQQALEGKMKYHKPSWER